MCVSPAGHMGLLTDEASRGVCLTEGKKNVTSRQHKYTPGQPHQYQHLTGFHFELCVKRSLEAVFKGILCWSCVTL